jgi:hypothetical protein
VSSRFEKHTKTDYQLKQHPMLSNLVNAENNINGEALDEAMLVRAECSEALKSVILESKAAWLEMDPENLSAKQLAVRKENALMLKFATVGTLF